MGTDVFFFRSSMQKLPAVAGVNGPFSVHWAAWAPGGLNF